MTVLSVKMADWTVDHKYRFFSWQIESRVQILVMAQLFLLFFFPFPFINTPTVCLYQQYTCKSQNGHFGVKMSFSAQTQFSDCTVKHTVMHHHDGLQFHNPSNYLEILPINQTVKLWRQPSGRDLMDWNRHCTALIKILIAFCCCQAWQKSLHQQCTGSKAPSSNPVCTFTNTCALTCEASPRYWPFESYLPTK